MAGKNLYIDVFDTAVLPPNLKWTNEKAARLRNKRAAIGRLL
ncbi:MAG: hypothetical protein ABJQ70_17735 [Roseobacter sp.]